MNDFLNIINYISLLTGLDPESVGVRSIENAVISAMEKSGINEQESLYYQLVSNPDLFSSLTDDIMIPETWFFRDVEPFNLLSKTIRVKYSNIDSVNPVRILSLACSTGEEPVSAAITLLGCGLKFQEFFIDAIDISKRNINVAMIGVYSENSFRNEEKGFRANYFTKTGKDYRLNPEILNSITYHNANLINSDFPYILNGYDFVFCKNLMIYLNQNARAIIIGNIKRILKEDGIIFAGHSEMMLFQNAGFKVLDYPRAFALVKEKTGNINLYSDKANGNHPAVRKKLNSQKKFSDIQQNIEPDKIMTSQVTLFDIRSAADNGNLAEAERLCQEFIRENIVNSEGYFLLGLINEASDNYEHAVTMYNKALYIEPNHYESLVHLSLLLEKSGESEKVSALRNRINRIS